MPNRKKRIPERFPVDSKVLFYPNIMGITQVYFWPLVIIDLSSRVKK